MSMIFRGLSVSALALVAAGCTTPNPTPLSKPGDVPPAFTAPTGEKTAPVWPETNWWMNFQAAELPALMAKAQADNLDLAAAAARVLQAEANDGVALSALLPQISGGADATRTGQNANRSMSGRANTVNAYTATFSGSYVLDFFGQEQDRLRQARETLRGARYAQTVVGLTTSSSVANAYFTVLSLRERITITRSNVDAAKRLLAVTQAKLNAGVSSNLDVATETVTVTQQESQLPGLIEEEREARYSLALLLGLPPEGFDVTAQNLDGVVSPAVQGGVPSELLLRRPDVAQAEASLYAAHANVDAARAAFFPQIGISGAAGWGAGTVDTLINPGNFAWSVGASILQTIFDGGERKAQSDLAHAQESELIADYRKTVFTAFGNVESALGTVQSENDQLTLITQEEAAAAEAFRISELQYREGTIDITTLLTAQQNLFTSQNTLVETKLARLQANIGLYIALGGGWTQQADDAAYKPQLDWWPL